MNTNGFYALCFEKDGYAQILWEDISENKFSICVKCLTSSWNESGIIFSLGTLFSVKIFKGRIGFSFKTLEKVLDEKVPLHCQNTFTAVYDGNEMLLYCNSFCVVKEKFSFNCADAGFIRIGEGLTESVVCKAMIFERCLNMEEVRSAIVGKPVDFYRQIDFTFPSENTNVELKNCGIENIVYTLDCCGGTMAVPQIRFPEKFTLFFSFFAFENPCGGVIFKTPYICVELCDSFGMGTPVIKVTHFDVIAYSVGTLKTNCWTDMVIIFDKDEISVYFNGKAQFRCTRNMTCETGEIQFGGFSGYINSCCVLNGTLNTDQIKDLCLISPGAFDKNVLRMYDFSEDLLQASDRSFIFNGAKLALVKGTGAAVSPMRKRKGPDSKREYSEFAQWQIKLLIELLVDWAYNLFGVYPNNGVHKKSDGGLDIDKNLYEFVYREIASMKEAQILLSHYDKLSPDELYALIEAMEKNGTLKKLLNYLYQEDEKQDPITKILLAILAVATLAALWESLQKTAAAAAVRKPPKRNDNDNDDDDDDDEKKKKTYISIKQSSLKSELKIEYDEKNINNQDTAGVFVKSGTSKGSLEVELSYKGDDEDFTIFVENKQGSIIQSAEKSVSFSGKKSVKITLDVSPAKFEGKYGKCTDELRWRCESKDKEQVRFLGETSVDIYFLENTPCEPWGNSINIECLKLCAECADNAGTNSKGFVEDYADFLKKRNQMISDSMQSVAARTSYKKAYSKNPKLSSRDAFFDAVGFSRDFLGKKKISARDLTHSHVIFSLLNGRRDIKSVFVSPVFSSEGKLLLNGKTIIDSHFVVKDDTGRIYDYELNSFGLPFSANQGYPLTGEKNSTYYRESNYLPGSYCNIEYTINIWQIGVIEENLYSNKSVQNMPIVGWVIRNNDGLYEHQGRTLCDWFVFDKIRSDERNNLEHNAVCHSISSRCIDDAIASICNPHIQDARHRVELLLRALYPNILVNNVFVNKYLRSTQLSSQALIEALEDRNDFFQHLILHFCFLAANSPANLRMGCSRWNSAVGASFDPESWFYYDIELNMFLSDIKGIDKQPFDIVEMRNRYGADVPAPISSGFYLPNRKDEIRIHNMRELGINIQLIARGVREDYDANENPKEYRLLYSSSNQFQFGEAGDEYEGAYVVNEQIYYLSGNQWTPI